jgi:hypothetical protein
MTVNRWFAIAVFFVGCKIGRPPPVTGPFSVAQVVTPVAEPGLKTALQDGLTRALSARTMLGSRGVNPVSVAVLSATSIPTGVGPNSQIFTARLQVSVKSGTQTARFSSERSYTVIDPVQGAASRAAAFEGLAVSLMQDAVVWLSMAPRGKAQ